MQKVKKIFSFVVPMLMVIAIVLSVVLPLTIGETGGFESAKKNFATADEAVATDLDKSQKSGALFLEQGATYTMNGGTISRSYNVCGGAVYVSSGATFYMNGGIISRCRAKYGGAIYVENGGKVIVDGGKIENNTAEYAPSIYCEDGGSVTIINEADIKDNKEGVFAVPFEPTVGEEEVVGQRTSSLRLKTMEFGSYPQTYVGEDMNDRLEGWFTTARPSKITSYIMPAGGGTQVWDSYSYEGQIYARGTCLRNGNDATYRDGSRVKATTTVIWFKVEPIKWYILRSVDNGDASTGYELLSSVALASYVRFNTDADAGNGWENSEIQTFLNGNFFDTAFSLEEQVSILKMDIANNTTGDYSSSSSDSLTRKTIDRVYLRSYYEMSAENGQFTANVMRSCSPTDFALSNNCLLISTASTIYRNNGVCDWWLRSAGDLASNACVVGAIGDLQNNIQIDGTGLGIRPTIYIEI